MRHFAYVSDESRSRLFHREPADFTADSPIRTLAAALGGTLYTPASRPGLADDIVRQSGRGVISMVLCLEDAVPDSELAEAETNLVQHLTELAARPDPGTLPLLFVRVRTPGQIPELVRRIGPAVRLLSGFVLPKFTEPRGRAFLAALQAAERASARRLYGMPVLESPELLHRQTRDETLGGVARVLAEHRSRVLAVRLGVTDFCSAYGLRRAPDMTAYDLQVVASVIADVVNVLARADGSGFTVTGPVWEYFRPDERVFRPPPRRTPFRGRAESPRGGLIEHDMDGLLREITLDQANGLLGKTCIHPSHVAPVHALSVVSHEEYSDAVDILRPERRGGGVLRSAYTNKMNEARPHRAWAERTMLRADAFGVAREDVGFVDLLAAGRRER